MYPTHVPLHIERNRFAEYLKKSLKSVAVAEMIPALLLIPSETTMTIMTKSGSSSNSTKC